MAQPAPRAQGLVRFGCREQPFRVQANNTLTHSPGNDQFGSSLQSEGGCQSESKRQPGRLSVLLPRLAVVGLVTMLGANGAYAATAVDDFYVLDPATGSEHLVVTYNDSITITTAESASLAKIVSVSSLSDSTAGSVSIDTDDNLSVNFTPAPEFAGTVSFQYTLQDIRGSSTATVTLQLGGANSSLQAVDDTYQSNGQPISLFPLENDFRPSSGTPTVTVSDPGIGSIKAESVTGLFTYTPPSDLTNATSVSFSYTVTYPNLGSSTANITVLIDPSGGPIVNGITDPAQRQLANVLEIACDANREGTVRPTNSALAATCQSIEGMDTSHRSEALEQILLRQVGAQGNSVVEMVGAQTGNISQRLDALRNGMTGISISGLRLRVQGQDLAASDLLPVGGSAGDEGGDGRLGVFVSGALVYGETDARDKEQGYDFDSQQFTIGVDYRFTDKLILGIASSRGTTDSESDGGATKLDTSTYNFAFYGNYYPMDFWYLDWLLGYGFSDMDSTRRIQFAGVNTDSVAHPQGNQWSSAFSSGVQFDIQGWQLGTFAGVEYRTVTIDAYTEHNDAGLGLDVDQQTLDVLLGHLGARVSHAFSFQSGVLIPQLEGRWLTELQDNDRSVNARLSLMPEAGSFSVTNQDIDNNYFDVGLSLTGVFKHGVSGFLRYGTELGRENFSVDTWELGGRMEFGSDMPAFPGIGGSDDQGVGVGLQVGTLGLGLGVTIPLYAHSWNLRGIISGGSYSTDRDMDDINYDIDVDLETYGMLLDWHPFEGGFRVSGGLFSMRNNATATANPTAPVEIGDVTFQPEEVGTLHGKLEYGHSAAPYVGIGWGNAVEAGDGFSFSADLGVMFTDSPTVSLTSDSPLAESNPALKAQLLQELAKEEQRINDEDLNDVKYWPVLTVGAAYHF